jgi:hypothetical protein
MRHSNWGSMRSATSGRKRKRTIRRATIVLVNCVTNPVIEAWRSSSRGPFGQRSNGNRYWKEGIIFVLEHRTLNGHEGGRLARSS